VWVARHSRLGECVSNFDTTIPVRLPRNLSLARPYTYTIHTMTGATEARNRSESQEQDEVRTQPTLHNTNFRDAEVGGLVKQNYHSSDEEQGTGSAKPGRKKNPKYVQISRCFEAVLFSDPPLSWSPCLRCPAFSFFPGSFCSSQAARRDQNRIAQREFRLRKQQRVRASSVPVGPAKTGQAESRWFG